VPSVRTETDNPAHPPPVAEFLESRPTLVPLLARLRGQLHDRFGDEPVTIERFHDPEEMAGPRLFVTVRTRRSPGDALRTLERFDRESWPDQLRSSSAPVVVTVEHV